MGKSRVIEDQDLVFIWSCSHAPYRPNERNAKCKICNTQPIYYVMLHVKDIRGFDLVKRITKHRLLNKER